MTAAELRRWDCGSRRNRLFRRQDAVPGARIPTLDEVLALASRGKFGFTIEVKSTPIRPRLTPPPERYAELLVRALRAHGLQRRAIVQSFDFRVLDAVRRLEPALRLSGLCGLQARDFVSIAREAGSRIVGPYHRMVTRGRVEAAHEAGIQVVPWTANRPRDWVRLIEAGVDGIITDDPAALVGFLGR
jgi:glycerophosphoryl diester phosphodiesterase